MNSHRATRTTAIGRRRKPLLLTLMLVTLWSAANALGQPTIRFYPIRSAPLGSPPGTVGNPVTPEFNSDLGCWEVRVIAGVEVDIDVQAFGWGAAPGEPVLGAVQATAASVEFSNGVGADLIPKGWPDSPTDGAYQAEESCGGPEGNGDPCVEPFDTTCDNGNNGFCVHSPDWVMSPFTRHVSAMALPFPPGGYAWATAVQTCCEKDEGRIGTLGGMILDVPIEAQGTYIIDFVPDPNNTFMVDGKGTPIPGLTLTPACITVEPVDFNRYVSFQTGSPDIAAYRLVMVSSLFHPDALVSGWVGEPDANGIAGLEDEPVMRTWDEQVVLITGCQITPAATFALFPMLSGGEFLPTITLHTTPRPGAVKFWGDVTGFFNGSYWTAAQGVVNIDDVFAVIQTWQHAAGAPSLGVAMILPRADVHPQEPNRIINFNDVLFVMFGFQGDYYPFGCPDDPCQDNIANPCL